MGNDPSKKAPPQGSKQTTKETASQDVPPENLTPSDLASLDPKIREWMLNPQYTNASQSRSSINLNSSYGDSAIDNIRSSGSGTPKSKYSGAISSPVRRSGDGILTVSTARSDADQISNELLLLSGIPRSYPIAYKSTLKQFFPPELRVKAKKIQLDGLETYKLFQHFVIRLNESSLVAMAAQDDIISKIAVSEHAVWSAANKLATCGVLMNTLETHISEAWNMQRDLERVKNRMQVAIKSIDRLLEMLPPDEKTDVGPSPFEVAPQLTKEYYLRYNYFSKTPYTEVTSQIQALENIWVHEILPFWNTAILTKRARSLWRQGIPPRLRSYIWQKAIGNKLNLSSELYYQIVQSNNNFFGAEDVESYKDHQLGTPSTPGTPHLQGAFSPMSPQYSVLHSSTSGTNLNDSQSFLSFDDPTSSQTTDPVLEITDTTDDLTVSSSPSSHRASAVPRLNTSSSSLLASESVFPDEMDGIPSSSTTTQYQPIDRVTTPTVSDPGQSPLKHESSSPSHHVIAHTASGKRVRPLIIRDSLRTFTKLRIFKHPRSAAHTDLVNVLHAVSTQRPDVGYIQGQSFLAGTLLMYMPADEAFIVLTNLLDHHFFKSFSKFDLTAIQVHVEAYEELLLANIPQLSEHFRKLHLRPEHYVFDWYVTLFSKPLNVLVSGIIWDCYMLEGPLVVPLITCALLKQYLSRFLQFNFEECMNFLQQLPEDMDIAQSLQDLDSFKVPEKVRQLFAPIWDESSQTETRNTQATSQENEVKTY